MEILKSPVVRKVVAGGALVLALAGCTNYSGEGNEFDVHGKVIDAGKQSLTVKLQSVESAQGDASDWFKVGEEHQLHDNCDCHGFWRGRKQYGQAYAETGEKIEPSEVAIGSCVEFFGKIRTDSDGKFTSERPVYDRAEVEPCVR